MQTEVTSSPRTIIIEPSSAATAPEISRDQNVLERTLLASASKLPTSHGTEIERTQAATRAANLVTSMNLKEADRDGELHRKRESGRYSLRQNPKRSVKVEA